MDERLLTPAEVAEYLQLAEKTVKDMLRAGRLRGVKVGSFWRVRREDLEQYINDHMNK